MGQHSVDIAIRARDEASAAFDSVAAKARGFLGGSFRGAMIGGAIKFASALAVAKVVIGDIKMLSAGLRGDWEGLKKAVDELPFGLGEIAKELRPVVESIAQAVVFRLKGIEGGETTEDLVARRRQQDVNRKGVENFNKQLRVQARERAEAARQAEAWDREVFERERRRIAAIEEFQRRSGQEVVARQRELEGLGLSQENALEAEVRGLEVTEEDRGRILALERDILRVKQEQAAAAEVWERLNRQAETEAREWLSWLEEEARATDDLFARGQALTLELRTGAEALADDLAEYRRLLEAGAITQETFERAQARRLGGGPRRGAEWMESRFLTRVPGSSAAQKTNEILSRQERIAQRQEEHLARIQARLEERGLLAIGKV